MIDTFYTWNYVCVSKIMCEGEEKISYVVAMKAKFIKRFFFINLLKSDSNLPKRLVLFASTEVL